MKKIYFSILTLLALSPVMSQSLTSANSPQVGDSYIISVLDSSKITATSQGGSGTGQTWDFSTYPVDSTIALNYIDPSTTPDASDFSGANVATSAQGAYVYYSTTSNFSVLGTYVSETADGITITEIQTYNPSDIYWTYPLSYGVTQAHTFSGTTNENYGGTIINIIRSGNDSVTMDATGSVITPDNKTIGNVLRLKTVQNFRDSSNQSASFGFSYYTIQITKTLSYLYYIDGTRYPVIKLDSTVETSISCVFGTCDTIVSSSRDAEYYQVATATGVTAATATSSISVYPNPANGAVTISLTSAINSLTLANVTGQPVLSSADGGILINGNTASMNVSALPKGVYILQTTSNSATQSQKLIVE